MSFYSSKFSSRKIGVDISDNIVHVVTVASNAVQSETEFSNVSAELTGVLSSGNNCTASLLPTSSIFVKLQPPQLPKQKLLRVLPSLLDIKLPFSLDECQYCFVEDGANEVASFAVRNSDLEARLGVLASYSCNPARVVPPAYAMWSLAEGEFPSVSDKEPRAIIFADTKTVTLAAGYGNRMTSQSVFGMTQENVVRNLKITFGGIPDNLNCIIAGPDHAAIYNAVKEAVKGDSRAIVNTAKSPEFFLARALAFDSLKNGKSDDTNLRIGKYAHKSQKSSVIRSQISFCAVILLSALSVFATSFLVRMGAEQYRKQSNDLLRATLSKVAGYNINIQGARGVQKAKEAMPSSIDVDVVDYFRPSISKSTTQIIAASKKFDIVLHHFSVDEIGFTASGSSKSRESLTSFLQELKSCGLDSGLNEEPKKQSDGSFQLRFFIHPTKQ